jgi:hypothetical protein
MACNIFRNWVSFSSVQKILNMKKIFFTALAIFSLLAVYSQTGNTQSRKVSGFTGVDVSHGIDLYLSNGPESVSVSASTTELRDQIITKVVHGVLKIYLEDNFNGGSGNTNMKAYVSLNTLKSLGASGGSDIFLKGLITAGDLTVELSGGGNMEGKINANRLSIEQSGGSSVDLSGKVTDLNLESSGGGNLKGYGLVADNVTINSSGGSVAELTANKEIRVESSGGSNVSYKGKAAVVSVNSSGGGSLTHRD